MFGLDCLGIWDFVETRFLLSVTCLLHRRADSESLDWDLCYKLDYFILQLSIYWPLIWVPSFFPSCLFILGYWLGFTRLVFEANFHGLN